MKRTNRIPGILAIAVVIALLSGCEEPPLEYTVTVEVYEGSNYIISNTTYAESSDATPVAIADCDEITVTGGERYYFNSTVTWTGAQASLGTQTLAYEDYADFQGEDHSVIFSNVNIRFDDDVPVCN